MVPLGRGTGCSKDHYDSCSRESALVVILNVVKDLAVYNKILRKLRMTHHTRLSLIRY